VTVFPFPMETRFSIGCYCVELTIARRAAQIRMECFSKFETSSNQYRSICCFNTKIGAREAGLIHKYSHKKSKQAEFYFFHGSDPSKSLYLIVSHFIFNGLQIKSQACRLTI